MSNEIENAVTDAIVDAMRRERVAELNSQPEITRESLEAKYGQVWTTDQLSTDFSVTGFAAPYVIVKRKSDGQVGSLEFRHSPRFYFNFVAD
jgi:hypothetical protein